MDWPIVIKSAVAGLAVVIVLCGGWWLWWRLPKRQVDRLRLTIRDPKARADIEDSTRKTIGQLLAVGGTVLAAAAVLIGAASAYLQFTQQQQTSQRQFTQQQQASHELLISNQVGKGFEQLGSDKVVVRLGGIHALEGVMNTSEQYHKPVLKVLCAFVRDGTRTETGGGPPATEFQAALTVIGRRRGIGTGSPDLARAHIPKADLSYADLRGAYLSGANLSGTNLSGANLAGADFSDANLSDANLSDANLSDANLSDANLSNLMLTQPSREITYFVAGRATNLSQAILVNTDLSRAHLSGADLSLVKLFGAILKGADLRSANLKGALLLDNTDLTDADLTSTDLSGANLSGATVSQSQLDKACGTNAKLNSGLILKPCHDGACGNGVLGVYRRRLARARRRTNPIYAR